VLRPILSTITVLALVASVAPAQQETRIEKGVTAPSSRRELAFPYQGIIGQVAVKKWDVVEKGQLLMKQDDRIEAKRLQGLEIAADRTLVIKAKQATLDNKQVELKRKTELYKRNALSESEFLSAQLEVVIAQAEVDVSRQEQKEKIAEKELQEVRVEYMTLRSPVDGVVLDIAQKEGEVADIDKPSITILQNDPLYVDIKTLPAAAVAPLKVGQELEIRYPGEAWQTAKISFISPLADARAGTHPIQLEMTNTENRSTGLEVEVKIPVTPATAAR
jgi:membrane fusion protein, macrolide-specific efflux system